jgi:hypothetical protein
MLRAVNPSPAAITPPLLLKKRIFNYLPLLEMTLIEMGLLGLVLHFCHRLLSGATHL